MDTQILRLSTPAFCRTSPEHSLWEHVRMRWRTNGMCLLSTLMRASRRLREAGKDGFPCGGAHGSRQLSQVSQAPLRFSGDFIGFLGFRSASRFGVDPVHLSLPAVLLALTTGLVHCLDTISLSPFFVCLELGKACGEFRGSHLTPVFHDRLCPSPSKFWHALCLLPRLGPYLD